jgi:16S rRNA (guanine(966)-N(2))-methyltransferase RsmD
MRIISGKFRGRRLQGPRGADLRPTSDRLKETLFDILGPEVIGSVFLDVFAGTGAIGLEGLSRGAREVVFIESSREAARLIRRNIELCGVTSGCRLLQGNVFTSLRTLAREGLRADIAFLDPPYHWGPYRDLLVTLFQVGIAMQGSRVVLEHHRKAALPESEPGFRCVRTVRQSDKCLSFYEQSIE